MPWPFLLWLHFCCWFHHVEPEFALRVALVESGTKHHKIRLGRLGHSPFYGPMGIHRDFLKKWPIDLPTVNIAVGVKALRGKDKLKTIKRYNPKATRAYIKAILGARRSNR